MGGREDRAKGWEDPEGQGAKYEVSQGVGEAMGSSGQMDLGPG